MKAKLLRKSGDIEKGAIVDLGGKTGVNDRRGSDDLGGVSATSAPVYAITDKDGHVEDVDTRDMEIVR
jgi:hypothetical protein